MSEPFIGEITMFAGNFAPKNWAFCDGQVLEISQNRPLYDLFGSNYGGDGRTTFGLPDMRGRVPLGAGSGPGLSNRTLGQTGGLEYVVLSEENLPVHTHSVNAEDNPGIESTPEGQLLAELSINDRAVSAYANTGSRTMNNQAVTASGGNKPYSSLMPYSCINFIVALAGAFPSRN